MGRVKLKASLWKLQQKTLEAAGLWAFIKDSNQFPHPDQQIVVSFIKTMDNAASLTSMMNLEVHTRENTQRERLQTELIQERQTIVLLQAEMEGLRVRLEEIQQIPLPIPIYILVQSQDSVEQLRRLEQENQEHQKTIELLKREVHRKEQRFWEEEANSPPSASLLRTYETQKELFLFLYDYRSGQKLSKLEFEELWHRVEVVSKENLLVEMLCRDILKLSDPLAAVILMGDVGARVTMYYMELELHIREKRGREMRPTSLRVTHFKDYGSDFYRIKGEGILMWCNMMMNYSQQ
jgi:hypothetical protein